MELNGKLKKALNKGNKENLNAVFEEIYNTYFKLVYYVIRYYVPLELVEDLTQDTFVNFFNHLENFDFSTSISSYLTRIAHNLSINELKRLKYSLDEDIEKHSQIEEKHDSIIPVLEKSLSKEEVDIIISHVIIGYSLQEIAQKKNENSNTIKSIYHRAIKKAKIALKENL